MEITFTWTPAYVVPDYNEPILVRTKNDKLIVFKDSKTFYGGDTSLIYSDWEFLVNKYNITHWVYQKELLKL